MPQKIHQMNQIRKKKIKKIKGDTVSKDAERAQKARSFAIKVWKMENHAQKDPDNCCNQEEKKFFLYLRQSTSHHWNFSPWSQPIIFARVRITARMRLP